MLLKYLLLSRFKAFITM